MNAFFRHLFSLSLIFLIFQFCHGCGQNDTGGKIFKNTVSRQSYVFVPSQGEIIDETATIVAYDSVHDEGFSTSQIVGDSYTGYQETRQYDDGTERTIERYGDGTRKGESIFTGRNF